jgi:hypothetical protein
MIYPNEEQPNESAVTSCLLAILSLTAALTVVLASILIDTTMAYSDRDLASVQLGLPIAYLSQDQSVLTPPSLPLRVRLRSPWEYPTGINPVIFVVDVALVWGCFGLVLGILYLASASTRNSKYRHL